MTKKKTVEIKSPFGEEEEDERPEVQELFKSIKKNLPELKKFFEKECNEHWSYDDKIYRFYHQSYKVWYLIPTIAEIVKKLESILPGRPLNKTFLKIVEDGLKEKEFKMAFNKDWLGYTRPILEAFFHARFFLEMIIKYGEEMKKPTTSLPSGWAAVLYLYNLR